MAFVNCTKCGAEVTDERKSCPHCGTEIVPAVAVAMQTAADDKERGLIKQIVALEQELTQTKEQNVYLKGEVNRVHSENEMLRKQISPAPPANVEHTGPGVIPITDAAKTAGAPPTTTVTQAATETAKTL